MESPTATVVGDHIGQVKWWNDRLGFGFITFVNKDEDIFVHHTGICPRVSNYRTLQKGEYVAFNITDGHNGQQAISVTGVCGGDLMCDVNRRSFVGRLASKPVSDMQPSSSS